MGKSSEIDATLVREKFLKRSFIEPYSGCRIWFGARTPVGYGNITVNSRTRLCHRLAYQVFVGPIPSGLWVLHKCDTPCCINPRHLFLGTPKINTEDMIHKKRKAQPTFGESHRFAKLTEADVVKIREIWRIRGRTQKEMGLELGVNQSIICRAIHGDNWRHVA